MRKCGNAFSRVIQKYTKFAKFTLQYFRHFTIFYTQTSQFHQIYNALSNCAKIVFEFKSLSNREMVHCEFQPPCNFTLDSIKVISKDFRVNQCRTFIIFSCYYVYLVPNCWWHPVSSLNPSFITFRQNLSSK